MLPLPGNFAMGHGRVGLAVAPDGTPLTTDQRGLPRTSNGTIGIGAAEVAPPTFPLVVTTTADELDPNWGPSTLSLREAMGFATTIGGPQSISFASGLSGTIALNSSLGSLGLNDMSGPVTIHGPEASVLSLRGAALFNYGVEAQIDSLGLADVSNFGTMTLVQCGAATISNGGTLTATGCTATGLDLGHHSAIMNCTISGSAGTDQVRPGGMLSDCTIHGVQIVNYSNNIGQPPTFIDCTITGPAATTGAYSLVMNTSGSALTLIGCTISGSQVTAVANLGGTLALTRCTLIGNSALSSNGFSGGALFNDGSASVEACVVTGNTSRVGGGIFNDAPGTLELTDCTIVGNSSTAGTSQSGGGGIDNLGTLTLSGCTITGNTCTPLGGQSPSAIGGGIDNSGTASLFNSTISTNAVSVGTATGAFVTGGGIENSGTLKLTNCTVAGNAANAGSGAENDAAGGGIYSTGGHVLLNNALVAANKSVDPNGTFSPDVGGAIDSSSAYNLIGDGDGLTGLTAADHNGDGSVGFDDLVIVARNYGKSLAAAMFAASQVKVS